MAANRHEQRARGVRKGPIHSEPNVQSGAKPCVRRDSGQQNAAAASVLREARDPVILRMQPSQRWPDEPFARPILRFIGPVLQPETRLHVRSEACCLCSLCADEGVEVFIRYQAPDIKEPGVSPIRGEKQIGGTRAGLQARRQSFSAWVGQTSSASWKFRTDRQRRLRRAALRISPVEPILGAHDSITETRAPYALSASHI